MAATLWCQAFMVEEIVHGAYSGMPIRTIWTITLSVPLCLHSCDVVWIAL